MLRRNVVNRPRLGKTSRVQGRRSLSTLFEQIDDEDAIFI